jgi:hypothetical protein
VELGLAQERTRVGAQPGTEPALGDVAVVAEHLGLLPRHLGEQLGEDGGGIDYGPLDEVDPAALAERDAPDGRVAVDGQLQGAPSL